MTNDNQSIAHVPHRSRFFRAEKGAFAEIYSSLCRSQGKSPVAFAAVHP